MFRKIAFATSLSLSLALLLGGCSVRAGTTGQPTMGEGQQEAVWVCHGKKNARWKKVPVPAADAHRNHGDRVSTVPREAGASCDQGERPR